jgi:hypothetical protein
MAQNRRDGPSKSIGLIRKDNRERKAKPQNKYLTGRTGGEILHTAFFLPARFKKIAEE